MPQQGNTDIIEAFSGSHLVELSVVANQGQDQIQEDMKNFSEQLKPYPFVNDGTAFYLKFVLFIYSFFLIIY